MDRAIDTAALEEYLALGMVPGERSIFRKIRKLPPAHVLVVDQDDFDRTPRRYWEFHVRPDTSRTLHEWQEALEAKVLETVRAHQIADVPVGAFLSGGLDSSAMVALQAGLSQAPVRTFSIGFCEQQFSELPYARQVAEKFGTIHTEEVITPEAVGVLDDLVRYFDEPFADPSAIPTLWVSRLARRSVKVVISGDGGDEAFGGYSRYAHDLWEAGSVCCAAGTFQDMAQGGLAAADPPGQNLPGQPVAGGRRSVCQHHVAVPDAVAAEAAVARRRGRAQRPPARGHHQPLLRRRSRGGSPGRNDRRRRERRPARRFPGEGRSG